MNVSTYLRTHLDEHGWTPSELARNAGVSRQYVNGLLNGSTAAIRLDKAAAIAHALGITVDEMAEALYGPDSCPE